MIRLCGMYGSPQQQNTEYKIMYSYTIKISNFKDKKDKTVTLESVYKMFGLGSVMNPSTYELLAVKKGLSERLGLTLDDVIIYIDGMPIL